MTKKILIRIDDVCPTMNWEQFEKAIKLFKLHSHSHNNILLKNSLRVKGIISYFENINNIFIDENKKENIYGYLFCLVFIASIMNKLFTFLCRYGIIGKQ